MDHYWYNDIYAGIILCMHPANERQHHNVMSSLIGWAHSRNDPCIEPVIMCETASIMNNLWHIFNIIFDVSTTIKDTLWHIRPMKKCPTKTACIMNNSYEDIDIYIVSLSARQVAECQKIHHGLLTQVCFLTHWGRDKMAAVSQTMFSNAFSWMKMYEFRLKFHWSLFLRLQLTIFQHWFRYWLGAVQATSHYLDQWWLVYWCIYASLGLNELKGLWRAVNVKLLQLTVNMWGPRYLGLTRLISWLLMPWRRKEPGHQQPWYWLCRIGRFLSYLGKDFNHLHRINVEKWHKM